MEASVQCSSSKTPNIFNESRDSSFQQAKVQLKQSGRWSVNRKCTRVKLNNLQGIYKDRQSGLLKRVDFFTKKIDDIFFLQALAQQTIVEGQGPESPTRQFRFPTLPHPRFCFDVFISPFYHFFLLSPPLTF